MYIRIYTHTPSGRMFQSLRMPMRLSISLLMLSATPGYWMKGVKKTVNEWRFYDRKDVVNTCTCTCKLYTESPLYINNHVHFLKLPFV